MNMIRQIDNYFLQKDEPVKSCLQFLREFILKQNDNITEGWKYSMPFYFYRGKRFCYLWTHKKYNQLYIGIVDGKSISHPDLVIEKRARMKILLIDPAKDIRVKKLDSIFKEVLALYK